MSSTMRGGSLAHMFYAKAGLAPFVAAARSHGKVKVSLPKFTIGTDLDLGSALAKMGMARAFSDKAQFGGMSNVPLKISKVVHKAWAAVDEKGIEAAAATAVGMDAGGMPAPATADVRCRSFVLVLRSRRERHGALRRPRDRPEPVTVAGTPRPSARRSSG
jgi:serine protease inhibitor